MLYDNNLFLFFSVAASTIGGDWTLTTHTADADTYSVYTFPSFNHIKHQSHSSTEIISHSKKLKLFFYRFVQLAVAEFGETIVK